MKTALILLAGGKGLRMGVPVPKQFLELNQKAIALHSLEIFDQVKCIEQIVVVAAPEYRHLFPNRTFADPGERRQDSVWNGLQVIDPSIDLVCIHDAARPFITIQMVESVLEKAAVIGASALGVPLKFTVKEVDESGNVKKTPDRSKMWEIQTPQAVRKDLLNKGFSIAIENQLTVTDDVSLVELFNHPVQLVLGGYNNLKLTTPEDRELAELFFKKAHAL